MSKILGVHPSKPMTTGGDLTYGGINGIATRLANGASGQVLTSAGGTSAPAWGDATAMVLISSQVISNAANVLFPIVNPTLFSAYVLVADKVIPATNGAAGLIRINTGAGYLSTNYQHRSFRWTTGATGVGGSASDSAYNLTASGETFGNGANQSVSFEVKFFGADSTTPIKRSIWSTEGLWSSGTYTSIIGSGTVFTQSAVIDGVAFVFNSGNISSGTFSLYGIKR